MDERRSGAGPGTWALVALGGAILAMLIGWAVAAAASPAGVGGPWGMMGGWFGATMPLAGLAMLLFWVAVILGIVALVRWAARPHGPGSEETLDAFEIARRRYARGEITAEQYQRLRDDLGADVPSRP